MPKPMIARLINKILIGDGCWEWTGAKTSAGYGEVRDVYIRRMLPAHRVVYELLVGPIGEGLELDHLCRNHSCVNPKHMEPVLHLTNVRRGEAGQNPYQLLITHCPKGHEYTEENTYLRGNKRSCKICKNLSSKLSKQRKRNKGNV